MFGIRRRLCKLETELKYQELWYQRKLAELKAEMELKFSRQLRFLDRRLYRVEVNQNQMRTDMTATDDQVIALGGKVNALGSSIALMNPELVRVAAVVSHLQDLVNNPKDPSQLSPDAQAALNAATQGLDNIKTSMDNMVSQLAAIHEEAGTTPETPPDTGGSDTQPSGTGDDTPPSGSGSDTQPSGSGSDTVPSGTGSDTVPAGSGNDTMPSGSGTDTGAPVGGFPGPGTTPQEPSGAGGPVDAPSLPDPDKAPAPDALRAPKPL